MESGPQPAETIIENRGQLFSFDRFLRTYGLTLVKPAPGSKGGIYNTAAGSEFVSRPAGQWQTAQTTIRGNRISVILNGVKIHDEVEVTKATGGELDQKLDEPGPIMLQGDHGAIAFRNIRIKPLK